MKLSLLARLGAAAALTAGLVFGAAPAQAAAPQVTTVAYVSASQQGSVATVMTPDYDGGSTDSVCATSSASAGQSALLPVARWADATTNMHSRLDGGILTDSAQLLQRNGVTSAGMGTGNFMWNLGTGMAQFAINFCIMNSAGGAADQIGSNIGKALLDPSSGVIAAIVVIVAVIFLARGMRRGSVQWKNLMMKGVIVGLFVVMVAGASASTGGGKDGSTAAYKPGVMSPGWIITGMNKAVGSLASAPAAALSLDSGGAGEKSADPLSCRNYVTSMKEMYVDRYGSGGAQLSSGVPLLLSGMWERAGLSTWRTAQFNSVNNGLDENVYCHVLEHNANSKIVGWEAGTVQSIMIGIMGGNTPASTPTSGSLPLSPRPTTSEGPVGHCPVRMRPVARLVCGPGRRRCSAVTLRRVETRRPPLTTARSSSQTRTTPSTSSTGRPTARKPVPKQPETRTSAPSSGLSTAMTTARASRPCWPTTFRLPA
jgi:hypothetical protein